MRWTVRIRILYQAVFLVLFLWLLGRLAAGDPRALPFSAFQHSDPLSATAVVLASGTLPGALIWALVLIALTLVFGRVFCGWICPVGTLHHAASWLTRRLRRGPYPRVNRWRPHFRLKYLLLVGLLVVAAAGVEDRQRVEVAGAPGRVVFGVGGVVDAHLAAQGVAECIHQGDLPGGVHVRAAAAGVDRARIAAEQAVASPLLEGVNLSGAKGVLVNITAAKGGLKMREVNEVMNTVKAFAAEDAHIIFGAVYDELMGDALRVTVVATGLGQAVARARQTFEVVNTPVVQTLATGTSDAVAFAPAPTVDYAHLEVPSVVRRGQRNVTVEALANSGVDRYDIPAFLRKQAD